METGTTGLSVGRLSAQRFTGKGAGEPLRATPAYARTQDLAPRRAEPPGDSF